MLTAEELKSIIESGSGISRIRDEIAKSGLPLPEFITEGMFSVIFKRLVKEQQQVKTREKTREKIIRLIQENSNITTNELASATGITEKGIEYHLKKLKEDHIIKLVGSDKEGKWVIIV